MHATCSVMPRMHMRNEIQTPTVLRNIYLVRHNILLILVGILSSQTERTQ